MIQDLCPSCGARCYSCDSLRVSLRCQAATNLALIKEHDQLRLEHGEVLRWINEARLPAALEELAQMDLRVKEALING